MIIPIFLCFSMLFVISSFAHGGKTDSNGGHRDNNNISGFGTYHYHCDGYPAHLHTDGICPHSPSYVMPASEKSEEKTESNSLTHGPAEPIVIHSPKPTQSEPEHSIFKSRDIIACAFFVAAYIAALLYRIFVSKELYYFPLALSILSLVAMFICLLLKQPALYVAGIAAVINLFCEK